ncbi:PiggyBac transposable element-derived protein 4 [Varanus komodoensis]|nr:PiggyBac transposable element-derived protein 4 [Varanus komodoensis]
MSIRQLWPVWLPSCFAWLLQSIWKQLGLPHFDFMLENEQTMEKSVQVLPELEYLLLSCGHCSSFSVVCELDQQTGPPFFLFVDVPNQTAYSKAHMSAEEALDLYFQSDSESDGFVSGDEEGAPYVGSCSEQEDFVPSEQSSSSSTDEEQPAEMALRTRAGDTASSGATGRRCGRKGGQYADRLASFSPDPAQGEHHGGATILKGRNGRTWHTAPQPVHRRIARDILREYPGPKRAAKKDTISETFELLLTEPILCLLIYETNREAERVTREWNQSNPTKIRHWKYLDVTELKAYIGLLLLAGLYRGHHETLEELWDSVSGRTFFRATMSLRRFSDITRFLRFDNKATRDSRRASDKLAAFRDVWAMFVEQLSKWYTPGADLTVDEQLVEFRGRCPFKQYIPNKPGKYGIKVWWCCDAGTAYPLMGEVYLGKRPGAPREAQLGFSVVTRVVEPYFHTGRNVVGSTFFTSIELAEELISKDLTYVGTLKRNKPYIPPEMQPHPCRKPLSSLFAFDGDYTLVSYVPKKGKAVLLLSSMHHATKVHGEFKKPDILSHYNATKSGVHTLDHLVRNYTCKRKINRWPMVLFFNMLDVAALASYVLWVHTHPQWENRVPRQRRRLFITALGKELIRLEVQRRMEDTPNLSASIRSAAHALGCVQQPVPPPVQPSVSKGRCHFCARAVDKKTTRWCSSCGKFVCKEHCITKEHAWSPSLQEELSEGGHVCSPHAAHSLGPPASADGSPWGGWGVVLRMPPPLRALPLPVHLGHSQKLPGLEKHPALS